MVKKYIFTLLIGVLVISLIGCGKNTKKDASTNEIQQIVVDNNAVNATTNNVSNSSDTDENTEEMDGLDFISDLDVERELFDVKFTVPKDYVEGKTQESLDAAAKEGDFKSATLNPDGSVTYEMSKKQHKKMMDEMAANIDTELNKMCGSEEYPDFVSITASENYTNFKVVSKSNELGLDESFSVLGFYMFGDMYNIFNGSEVDNIHVDFIYEATGEVFNSADSKDMADN